MTGHLAFADTAVSLLVEGPGENWRTSIESDSQRIIIWTGKVNSQTSDVVRNGLVLTSSYQDPSSVGAHYRD